MRVALDVRNTGMPGIGRMTVELWNALLTASVRGRGVEVVALGARRARSGWLGDAGGETPGPVTAVRSRPFLPGEQVELPRLHRRLGIDVHHAPHFNLPYRACVPVVLTIHDLFPLRADGNARSSAAAAYYRAFLPRAIARADALVAVSGPAADQLVEQLDVARERITVIEHGVDVGRFRPATAEELTAVRSELDLPGTFACYLGTAKSHKNLGVLLSAWAASGRTLPPLVLAGPTPAEVREGFGEIPSGVRILGRVAERHVGPVLAAATVVLQPSRLESVGLTALEAMACGTPVVVSDVPGLRDTAAGAGATVSPDDPVAWVDAVLRACLDREWREAATGAGLVRAKERSWADAANHYVAVYHAAAGIDAPSSE